MFYYYGSKTLLARYYPEPEGNVITESFAGSAAYSIYHLLNNNRLKAFLVEKDPRVYETWKWLLNATPKDIQNYPVPEVGEKTSDFLIMTCAVSNAVAKCKELKYTDRIARVFEIQKKRLIKALSLKDRIEVICDDFTTSPNVTGTNFIDPPYQVNSDVNKGTVFPNGNGYSKQCNSDNINYEFLSEWCKSRKGLTIVCEKNGADWLPFIPLKNGKTSLGKLYKEVYWVNR